MLTELTVGAFYGNLLEGSLPTHLGILTSVMLLSLGDNTFTGMIPSELGLLTNLSHALLLDRNQLYGTIPVSYTHLTLPTICSV